MDPRSVVQVVQVAVAVAYIAVACFAMWELQYIRHPARQIVIGYVVVLGLLWGGFFMWSAHSVPPNREIDTDLLLRIALHFFMIGLLVVTTTVARRLDRLSVVYLPDHREATE